jgi:hypothetical protein
MEELATAVDLADAFGQGFAFFSRQQFAELFLRRSARRRWPSALAGGFPGHWRPTEVERRGQLNGLAGLFGAGLMVLVIGRQCPRAVVAQSGVAFTPWPSM